MTKIFLVLQVKLNDDRNRQHVPKFGQIPNYRNNFTRFCAHAIPVKLYLVNPRLVNTFYR